MYQHDTTHEARPVNALFDSEKIQRNRSVFTTSFFNYKASKNKGFDPGKSGGVNVLLRTTAGLERMYKTIAGKRCFFLH
jgi:hypothetical protein